MLLGRARCERCLFVLESWYWHNFAYAGSSYINVTSMFFPSQRWFVECLNAHACFRVRFCSILLLDSIHLLFQKKSQSTAYMALCNFICWDNGVGAPSFEKKMWFSLIFPTMWYFQPCFGFENARVKSQSTFKSRGISTIKNGLQTKWLDGDTWQDWLSFVLLLLMPKILYPCCLMYKT